MHTDVVPCNGCGADVVVTLHGLQQPNLSNTYCPGCTKLNAAKAVYAAQQKGSFATTYGVGGTKVAYAGKTRRTPQGYPSSTTGAQSTTQCSFTWDMPRSAYAVKCEYQPNFIEFIKAKVPASDRAWDPTSKTWYVKDAWFDILFELANQLWPDAVGVVTREQSEKAWKEQEDARSAMLAAQRQAVLGPLENAILEFASLCDVDALRAARNKMAIALHPDKGGDPNKMAKLNATWFVVESELKKLAEKK
jgi:hypothetical protein